MTIDNPRPTASEMLHSAVSLQGANMLQKAQMDMMATKLIMALKVVKSYGPTFQSYEDSADQALGALDDIAKILAMTREDVAATRAQPGFNYPDVRIQAVINEATEKIAQILLDDGKA